MEITVFKEIEKFFPVKGIIQVGSNTGQEMSLFKLYTKNIVCFEPIAHVFKQLKEAHPDVLCYNVGLGDINETKEMFIATNNGESSSFLRPLNHYKAFPYIGFEKTEEKFQIKRFDSLGIDMQEYNILVSDTQ